MKPVKLIKENDLKELARRALKAATGVAVFIGLVFGGATVIKSLDSGDKFDSFHKDIDSNASSTSENKTENMGSDDATVEALSSEEKAERFDRYGC